MGKSLAVFRCQVQYVISVADVIWLSLLFLFYLRYSSYLGYIRRFLVLSLVSAAMSSQSRCYRLSTIGYEARMTDADDDTAAPPIDNET
jgi:glucan phosphoethanolaminetransferase (alkaline phosphatase superfamily)